jgi:hypothetical protein
MSREAICSLPTRHYAVVRKSSASRADMRDIAKPLLPASLHHCPYSHHKRFTSHNFVTPPPPALSTASLPTGRRSDHSIHLCWCYECVELYLYVYVVVQFDTGKAPHYFFSRYLFIRCHWADVSAGLFVARCPVLICRWLTVRRPFTGLANLVTCFS